MAESSSWTYAGQFCTKAAQTHSGSACLPLLFCTSAVSTLSFVSQQWLSPATLSQSSQQVMAGVAVAYVLSYMLMYVVREPSVPQWDRGGNSILSYPILNVTT